MKFHLMALGYKVWRSVEIEYEVPDDVPIDEGELSHYEANAKALNEILSSFNRISTCKSHAMQNIQTCLGKTKMCL